jgi:hypothetical protein
MISRLLADILAPRFLAWAVVWSATSLVAFGIVSAIIPNPIFGREIAPEPFAIWVWIASAPLMGLIAATYVAPLRPVPAGTLAMAPDEAQRDGEGTVLGTFASFGAFLAIGCPVCNKLVLLFLGTSGAMTLYAPIQPVIGVASLVLLVGALAWRLRTRARGGACPT